MLESGLADHRGAVQSKYTAIHLMPVNPHRYVAQPAPESVICRFMDFDKFRDLFANEELYLRRTDKFKEDDPWEALSSDEYIRAKLGLRRYDPTDELKVIEEHILPLRADKGPARQAARSHNYRDCR